MHSLLPYKNYVYPSKLLVAGKVKKRKIREKIGIHSPKKQARVGDQILVSNDRATHPQHTAYGSGTNAGAANGATPPVPRFALSYVRHYALMSSLTCEADSQQGGQQPKISGGPKCRYKVEKRWSTLKRWSIRGGSKWPGAATGGPRPARQ